MGLYESADLLAGESCGVAGGAIKRVVKKTKSMEERSLTYLFAILVRRGFRTSVLHSRRPEPSSGLSAVAQQIADTRVLFQLPWQSYRSGNASGSEWEISGWHESHGRRSAR